MFLESGKATVLIDGQYGSAGKGAVAGWIASRETPDVVVSNSGSQAGHTFVDGDTKIVSRHIPVAALVNDHPAIYLGPACVIDLDVLIDEIERYRLPRERIVLHPNAAVITQLDIEMERALTDAIGSTGKGNGSALAGKILRQPRRVADHAALFEDFVQIDSVSLNDVLRHDDRVLIEGAQGFSLSLDERFYPHCTSRNCWAGQALADAWVHPDYAGPIVMVVRAFPIRVAGPSGPCYPDQQETNWGEIGVEPEITTVTKKIRRVFTFSQQQLKEAASANRPDWLAISHLDYLPASRREEFVNDCLRITMSTTGKPCLPIYGKGPNLRDWGLFL